jgi:hypothetical protein
MKGNAELFVDNSKISLCACLERKNKVNIFTTTYFPHGNANDSYLVV